MSDDTAPASPYSDPNFDPDYVLDEVTVTSNFNLPILIGIGALLAWSMMSDTAETEGDL